MDKVFQNCTFILNNSKCFTETFSKKRMYYTIQFILFPSDEFVLIVSEFWMLTVMTRK